MCIYKYIVVFSHLPKWDHTISIFLQLAFFFPPKNVLDVFPPSYVQPYFICYRCSPIFHDMIATAFLTIPLLLDVSLVSFVPRCEAVLQAVNTFVQRGYFLRRGT